jgi:DNA-binding IclR family transcriptional regulator
MAARGSALTLSQLARDAGRRVSEIQRTVACLLAEGYLTRDRAGVYRLSSKLYRLAHANPPQRELVARAYPVMADCARVTGESVHLGVLAEGRLLLVAEAQGAGLVRVSLQMGAALDTASTVSGRILLAFSKDAPKTGVGARELAAIRRRGYELAESGHFEGIWDLGVPVLDPGGEAVAAVTSPWLKLRGAKLRWKELLPELKRCAARISAQL